MVVAHHMCVAEFLPGLGVVGVTTFFVLSGYLIAGVLITGHNLGRSSGRQFFARRATRLVPAPTVMLVALGVLQLAGADFAGWSAFFGAATYSANWQIIATGSQDFGALLPVWSLAIEAQFYVIYGLAALWALRRGGIRALRLVTATGLGLVLLERVVLVAAGASSTRIYVGTDTAMSSLLVGSAIVTVLASGHRAARVPLWVGLVALAGLAMLPYAWWVPVAVSVAAGVVVASNAGSRVLENRWLRLVGERSYGLYLWHVPAIWVFGLTPLAPLAAWGMTLLSWRFVEKPVTQWMRRRSGSADVMPRDACQVEVDGAACDLVGPQFDVVTNGEVNLEGARLRLT